MGEPGASEKPTNTEHVNFVAIFDTRKTVDIPLLKEASKGTGVRVDVLAKAGERYATLPPKIIVNGKQQDMFEFTPYTGVVEQGESYLMFSGIVPAGRALQDYQARYDRLKAEQDSAGIE